MKIKWHDALISLMFLLAANFIIILGAVIGIPILVGAEVPKIIILIFALGTMSLGILLVLGGLINLGIFEEEKGG